MNIEIAKKSYCIEAEAPELRSLNILDSGMHSRLYAFVMSNIQNGGQATFQIGELARRTALSIDAILTQEKSLVMLRRQPHPADVSFQQETRSMPFLGMRLLPA